MRKRILASIILVCSAFTATLFTHKAAHASNDTDDIYSISTFTTPYGASIKISYLQSEDEIKDHPSLTIHPNAVRIENGSKKYNCFTYALIYAGNINNISQHSDDELFGIEEINGWLTSDNPCLTRISFSEASVQDIVIYKDADNSGAFFHGYSHAAIIHEKGSTPESTVVISKWDKYAIYRHVVTDCPYIMPSPSIYNLLMGQNPQKIVELSFYKFSHNYTYTAKVINPPTPAGNPKSHYHKAQCSGCGAFHYEPHSYINSNNYVVCKYCDYITGYMYNSVNPEIN